MQTSASNIVYLNLHFRFI